MEIKKCVCRNLQKLLDVVGRALSTYLASECLEKKSQNLKKVRVYDVLNVEQSSRFSTLGGTIAHNCLGLSFLMSKYGLAIKLTEDTGRVWTEEEAQEQIDLFYDTYSDLAIFQKEVREFYESGNPLKLPDGWTMFCDNDNFRSSTNFAIQGSGAAIMRRAVDIAVSKGVDILFTLHDALYMIAKVGEEEKIGLLRDAMSEAFSYYYKSNPYLYEKSKMIRLDPFAWSPDYERDSTITLKDGWKVDVSDLYRDERAIKEYEKFSKYFNRPEEMDL